MNGSQRLLLDILIFNFFSFFASCSGTSCCTTTLYTARYKFFYTVVILRRNVTPARTFHLFFLSRFFPRPKKSRWFVFFVGHELHMYIGGEEASSALYL
uniref:Putative secreted protein n=1 Tax=Ixodes scapularis TaxID=6945 RepID=A0A4D5RGU5_IXOSC